MKLNFRLSKRFGQRQLTPKQREIVDRLERGEISADEAERLLGGSIWSFGVQLGDPPTEKEPAPVDPAAAPEPEPRAETPEETKARELVERIAREEYEKPSG